MNYLKKEEQMLEVTELYPYRYDYGKGKSVLRLQVPSKVSFDTIQAFFSEVSDYDYYENDCLKTVYTQYGADLDIHYKQPVSIVNVDDTVSQTQAYYDVEIMRDPSLEASIRILYKVNQELQASNQTLQMANQELEKNNQTVQLQLKTLETQKIESEVDIDYRLSIIELGLN